MENRYKNHSIMPIFFVVLLDLIGISIIIPIVAPLLLTSNFAFFSEATSQRAKEIVLGFLLAAFPIALFFGSPILGGLSDRIGRKKFLMFSLIGTFTNYILFALGITFESLPLLFISRFIAGFASGNLAVVFSSIADISDIRSKTKNFGRVGMAFGIGFIIGPFIGGILSDKNLVTWFSAATPIYFAALLSLFNILLVLKVFKETLHTKINTHISLLTGFKNIKKGFCIN